MESPARGIPAVRSTRETPPRGLAIRQTRESPARGIPAVPRRAADTPGRGLAATRRGTDRPARAESPDAGTLFRAPPELSAHTFRVGSEEFAVLSYPVAPLQPPAELTNAERHVVAALLLGKSNAEIAKERGTSPRTIANQVAAVFRKLGVRSRAELAARCARGPSEIR